MIRLEVTGLRKIRVVYLLDLFDGRGKYVKYDLVCKAPLDDCANSDLYMLMSYSRVVSVILILWGVGTILRNECRI